jgi:hypothetical protein
MHAKRKFMRNQPRKQNLIAQTRRQRLKRHEDGKQPEYSIQRKTPSMLEDNSCVPNTESKPWLHRPTVEYPLLMHTN